MPTVERRLPDALLCLDGVLPPPGFFAGLPALPLIAADGAALQLDALGIMPSVIIGDMDTLRSSGREHRFADTPQLHIGEQDSTDFEKCLEYCITTGLSTVLVCGIHGGEMEHSLNNWSIAVRYGRRLNLCLYDSGRYALPLYRSAVVPTQAGEIISLIPQPHAVLTTEGLHWPLTQEELHFGMREGARNRATGSTVSIQLHEGSLLLFCNAEPPLVPVDTAA